MCVHGVVCMGLQECMEGWLVINLGCHSSGAVHIYLCRQVSHWPWTQCVGKTNGQKVPGITCLSLPSAGMKGTHYSSCFFTARFEGPLYITYKVINLALYCILIFIYMLLLSLVQNPEGRVRLIHMANSLLCVLIFFLFILIPHARSRQVGSTLLFETLL